MAENLYTEMRRLSPKVTGGLVRMREETFKDAAVPYPRICSRRHSPKTKIGVQLRHV